MSSIRVGKNTEADLLDLNFLVLKAIEESPYSADMETDPDEVTKAVESVLSASPQETVVLFLEDEGKAVGVLIGMIVPSQVFLSHTRVASERCWYVEPGYRKGLHPVRLVKAFERWAKLMGADKVFMGLFENDKRPALTRLYNRLGYTTTEEVFTKDL